MDEPGTTNRDIDARPPLAAALRAACERRGIEADPRLALLHGSDGGAEPPPIDDAWDLGTLHQRLTGASDQTRRGAWYTPRWLAQTLVDATVDSVGVVLDPACGGGVFLLAAAERLVDLGADPADVATDLVRGIDIDPLAVEVSRAALWWWAKDHGVDMVPDGLIVDDALVGSPWPDVDFVVGNPPFLGQLRAATTNADSMRSRLRDRFGTAVAAYTDPAALFLVAATEAVRPGGAVTLIQPQSVLATRDTTAARARVDALADLQACWFDDGRSFDAAVDVCAPTLRRRPNGSPGATRAWSEWLADHVGIPAVRLDGPAVLSTSADVLAGFRDQYYGLVDAVVDGGDGPRLVTSGAIDPFVLRDDRPVAFAKRRWVEPRLLVDRVTDSAVAWVQRQLAPSVLVASQTRIVECVVDETGDLVVGVPGLAVIPHDPDDLWPLAAALAAPCVSAWLLRQSVGTGMSTDALRPTAPLLSRLPVPADTVAWTRAADAARRLTTSANPSEAAWAEFARLADAAYGIADPALIHWWWNRHPARRGSGV